MDAPSTEPPTPAVGPAATAASLDIIFSETPAGAVGGLPDISDFPAASRCAFEMITQYLHWASVAPGWRDCVEAMIRLEVVSGFPVCTDWLFYCGQNLILTTDKKSMSPKEVC